MTSLKETKPGDQISILGTVVRHNGGQTIVRYDGVGSTGQWSMPGTLTVEVVEEADPDLILDDEDDPRVWALAAWWREQAEAEIDMVVEKAIEYGARDLKVMGHELAAMAGRSIDDEEAAELGCAMYLAGKMARVTAAIAEGRRPSLDTYLDIGIYTRMVQRIREVGAWPGV